ncbi:hypothetical protein IBX73_06035, partial [candidate division WOR-3 bacterium]|nr:hypothetical protein [candidate division WOR-3 bacterium]
MRKFLCILVMIAASLWAYDYPMKPFTARHQITSSFGESRGNRFHNGVDILPRSVLSTDTCWLVYSIVSDTMRRWDPADTNNNGVYDINGNYWYLHLYNRVEDFTYCTAFVDTIGRIKTGPGLNHCHFIEMNSSDVYVNPLRASALSPFIDTASPIIESISLKRQGSGVHLSNDTLSDTVDIVVRVYDPRVDTTGAGAGRGMGIYRIQYEILDTLKNIIAGASNVYQFDSLPLNDVYARHDLVYHDSTVWNSGIFYYWATNAPFSDTANQYWNTKQHTNRQWYESPAESIEVAKFKDGYFYVMIKSWDICRPSTNPCDSETVMVHVDNFNPRVKIAYPTDHYHHIEKYEKEVWCTFSEAMDTATLIPANITIRSLVDTSYYYSIVNITFIDSLFKLVLEVDSFFFHDEVEVRLSDSIKDLAGKSVEQGGGGEKGVAYSWKFTVGVIKLTDNDIDDIRPDIYGDKIAWVEILSPDPLTSNTKLHDLTSHNTVTLNTTTGFHNWPIVWKDQVAWRQEFGSEPLCRDRIYYYDGNSTQLIVSEDLCRNQFDFDSCGIVMYSSVYSNYSVPDTIWVQYYEIGSGLLLLDEYTVRDDLSRDVNIDGDQIVWEHAEDASGSDGGEIIGSDEGVVLRYERGLRSGGETKRVRIPMDTNGGSRRTYVKDIYLRSYSGVSNLTGFMDTTINGMPSLSHGQSAWVSWIFGGSTLPRSVWMSDGASSRQLSGSLSSSYRIYWPTIENGDVVWHDWDWNTGQQRLHYYDGRQDNILAYGYALDEFAFSNWLVENDQAVWLQLTPSYNYNPTYYDGEQTVTLVDRGSSSYRIGVNDGLVVYDAWDGNDYEIYLYIGDTLFTPPALARNVRNEILETDDKEKQDARRMAEAASKNPGKAKSVDEADTQTREDTQVRVIWSPNSEPDLAGYNVYRSETAYTYGTIPYGTVLANDTIFLDTIPVVSTNYYVVTAFDDLNNESGFSNQTLADLTPDTIPPPPPENLAAACDSPYQQVSLVWSPVFEPEVSYRVYRADSSGGYTAPLAAVEDTVFADTTVVQGYTYYYVVTAVDTLSNESGYSNEDTILVPDITPPSPPTNLAAACDSPYQAVDLTWDSMPEPDVGLYRIYRADSSGGYSTPLGAVADSVLAYADSTIVQGMTYYYVVTAVDTCNNESDYSNEDTIFVPDITPPPPPANLVAAYDSLNHRVSLIWDSGTEPDLWLYRIYRSDTSGSYTLPYDSVYAPDTMFFDFTISSGMTYYYVVSAVDTNNNESVFSNEDSVTIPDTLPPSPPANLVALCDSPYQAVDLTWDSVPEPDVAVYRIYRSDTTGVYATPMDSVSASVTAYADSTITQGMRYYYVVTAVDTSRNESEYSNEDSVLVPDITPPAAPDNLVALYDSIYRAVELNWNAPPEPDLALHRIYRSGTSGHYTAPLDSVLEPITTYIDLAISFDTTYYYVVTAVDTCRNESEYSNEQMVVIPDTTPPSVPTNLAAVYDSMSQATSLSWIAPSDPDIELYRLYRSEISG